MLKKVLLGLVSALLVAAPVTFAQNATKQLTIAWTLPTKAMDGTDLSGSQALTKIQVFISGSSIPDTSTITAAAELGPGVTTTVRPVTLPVGGTAYVRLKACNSTGCSDFSAESKATFPTSVPGVPTSVTVTVVLQ